MICADTTLTMDNYYDIIQWIEQSQDDMGGRDGQELFDHFQSVCAKYMDPDVSSPCTVGFLLSLARDSWRQKKKQLEDEYDAKIKPMTREARCALFASRFSSSS